MTRFMRTACGLVTLAIVVGTLGRASPAETVGTRSDASSFIESLAEKARYLSDNNHTLVSKSARGNLERLIHEGFDLDLTGRLVLGRFWGLASEIQRAEFRILFAEYLVHTYARQLNRYQLDTLEVVSANQVGERDLLVRTTILSSEGVSEADWRLRVRPGDYKIIDIFVDGISLALTHRGEFASVIRRHGFEGMLDVLRERVSVQAESAQALVLRRIPASVLLPPNLGRTRIFLPRN